MNSHAKVTEYRLYYRQQPPHHHRSHHQETLGNGTVATSYKNQWSTVAIPGTGMLDSQQNIPAPYPGVTMQKMSYLIRGLSPATTYDARVQAKNVHGWNKLSPTFHFTTRSNGESNNKNY